MAVDWHPAAADEAVALAGEGPGLAGQVARIWQQVGRLPDPAVLASLPEDRRRPPPLRSWQTRDLTVYVAVTGDWIRVLHVARGTRPFDHQQALDVARARWEDWRE